MCASPSFFGFVAATVEGGWGDSASSPNKTRFVFQSWEMEWGCVVTAAADIGGIKVGGNRNIEKRNGGGVETRPDLTHFLPSFVRVVPIPDLLTARCEIKKSILNRPHAGYDFPRRLKKTQMFSCNLRPISTCGTKDIGKKGRLEKILCKPAKAVARG